MVFKISPSEKFSPPPTTLTTTTRSYPHAVRRLCVGSKSELRRPRFVAVTAYRCRVRFRRPNLIKEEISSSKRLKNLKYLACNIRRYTLSNYWYLFKGKRSKGFKAVGIYIKKVLIKVEHNKDLAA